MFRGDKLQIFGILVSLILIFALNGVLFWIHLLSVLYFHFMGLANSYLDAPFNDKSFADEWQMTNNFERLLFHALPEFAILKKIVKKEEK